jgi:hypothetical protein
MVLRFYSFRRRTKGFPASQQWMRGHASKQASVLLHIEKNEREMTCETEMAISELARGYF